MVRLLLILLAGCYHPSFIDCTVACGENHSCPEGLSCQDRMCAQPRKQLLACTASPVRQLSVGGAHACVIKFDATLWCWGANDHGQVDGSGSDRTKPAQPDKQRGWASVSAGAAHTCALRRDGSAFCWGENSDGRLGVGDSNPHASPVPVAGDWVTISAAGDRTCGTQKDGTLWCWGRGENKPKQQQSGVAFAGVQDQNVCTISPDRALACPDSVPGSWEQLSVGATHFCAIDAGGSLFCSGANESGQIGDGSMAASASAMLGSGFEQVSAGAAQTCAVHSSGALSCWGKNDDGRLGDNSSDPHPIPNPVGGSDWILVQTGGSSSCGAHANGLVQCWGANDHGQIGDGTVSPRPVPTDVAF